MEWRTDMSFAPRHGYGEGVQWVILALKDSDKMIVSYWLPQDHTNRDGSWLYLRPGEEPVAWCAVDHPSPPKPEPKVTLRGDQGGNVPKIEIQLPPGIPKIEIQLPPGIPGITL